MTPAQPSGCRARTLTLCHASTFKLSRTTNVSATGTQFVAESSENSYPAIAMTPALELTPCHTIDRVPERIGCDCRPVTTTASGAVHGAVDHDQDIGKPILPMSSTPYTSRVYSSPGVRPARVSSPDADDSQGPIAPPLPDNAVPTLAAVDTLY